MQDLKIYENFEDLPTVWSTTEKWGGKEGTLSRVVSGPSRPQAQAGHSTSQNLHS